MIYKKTKNTIQKLKKHKKNLKAKTKYKKRKNKPSKFKYQNQKEERKKRNGKRNGLLWCPVPYVWELDLHDSNQV